MGDRWEFGRWVMGVLGAVQDRAAPAAGTGDKKRGHCFLSRSQWGQRAGPERAREARLQDIWAGGRRKLFVQEVKARLCMALRSLMGREGLGGQRAWLGMGWGRFPQPLREAS